MAQDYSQELDRWTDSEYYDVEVRKIQLPFTAAPTPAASGLALEQQQQRRRDNVKRLVEINAKKREERVIKIVDIVKDLFLIDPFDSNS